MVLKNPPPVFSTTWGCFPGLYLNLILVTFSMPYINPFWHHCAPPPWPHRTENWRARVMKKVLVFSGTIPRLFRNYSGEILVQGQRNGNPCVKQKGRRN